MLLVAFALLLFRWHVATKCKVWIIQAKSARDDGVVEVGEQAVFVVSDKDPTDTRLPAGKRMLA